MPAQKVDGTCLCTGYPHSEGSPRGCVDDAECEALYGPGTACIDNFFYERVCHPTACYLPCEGDPSTGYCCSPSPSPGGGGCGSDSECADEFGDGHVCRVSNGNMCYTRSTVCHLPCLDA